MEFKYEELLRQRAHELEYQLQQAGVDAHVLEGSLREHSIRVGLPQGRAVIHYKPSSKTYKCLPEKEPDETTWAVVAECWEKSEERRICPVDMKQAERQLQDSAEVYVDGSYTNKVTSYGFVVVNGETAIYEEKGIVPDEEADGSRQVAGELEAVRAALKWCQSHEIRSIILHYDYEGIMKWATGQWKANKPMTQRFRDEMMENCGFEITWEKVKAHTGSIWNERADELAKQAAGQSRGEAMQTGEPRNNLAEVVQSFIEVLSSHGIEAEIKLETATHIQARLSSGSCNLGCLNFYCSASKDPYPKFHEIRQEEQENLKRLWQELKTPPASEMEEIEYYHSVFKRYSGLRMDFRILADATARLWNKHMNDQIAAEELRYDFRELEKHIVLLRQQINGASHNPMRNPN